MESNFSSKVNGFEYNYDVSFLPNHSTPNLGFGVPSSSEFNLHTNHWIPTTQEQDQDHQNSPPNDENALLRYINQLLMEESSIMEKQSTFYDSLALQQTEEMLQQVIRDSQSQSCMFPSSISGMSSEYWSSSSDSSVRIETVITKSNETEVLCDPHGSESVMQFKRGLEEASKFLPNTDQWIFNLEHERKEERGFSGYSRAKKNLLEEEETRSSKQFAENVEDGYSRARKNLREREEEEETRSSKQFAENVEDGKLTELFDKVLLLDCKSDPQIIEDGDNVSRKTQTRGKKKSRAIDFRTLLTLCAQSISTGDKITSDDLLRQIRKRCTPLGDASQRVAYFFANALEARLEGNTGTMIKSYYDSMTLQKRKASQILKAYRVFLSSSPFMTLIYFFSNKMIYDASQDASVLHIIDFGILYGWQWPMFIQHISRTKTGPKKLRITGIELPQQGFRPTERIEDTGRRLTEYCKRFDVPFEYNAIASKNWETIKIEEFKIRPNEVLAVNSVLRFKNLQDVTSDKEDCPRDRFLKLIRDLNPDICLISTINGSFNAPFFTTRFKEALFHYSSLFDMFDSTLTRENSERIYFEGEFYGREVMNVIACEGVDRVERPETYKQWQVRMMRAGFRQKLVEEELVERFREKMKKWGYHKDFVLDEDCNWFLQGWKGRILFSSSCWIPT